jgi:3-dehydroquinate synthetase
MAPVVDLDLGWLEGDAVAVGMALEAVLAEALAVLLK